MSNLKEQIGNDLKDAMRAKEAQKLGVLRMLKTAIQYKEVEPGAGELDDAGVVGVVGTLIKQRRDSVDQFVSAGREDLAETERAEIEILQAYLPPQLSAEALAEEVAKAATEANAGGPKDLGAVMKILSPRVKGRAEGRAVNEAVKAHLASLGS